MASKRYDLPHLAFFQGFEAAARMLSFTKAAEELFITQSAVSRQIKALEEHPLKRPQDLAHHTLLHFDYAGAEIMYMDWGTWLTALGIGELRPAGALHFSQYEQMIQAAISGQGVALGRQPLLNDLIESGALVAPFKQTLVGSR